MRQIQKYNSKIHIAYLNLHNLDILDKLKYKRAAIKLHKESMSNKTKYLKKITLELLLQSSFKLAMQIMTLNESNIDNIKIYIKEYLNELHHADKLTKKFINSEKEKPIWLAQYNNFNLLYSLVMDILRNKEKGI